MDRAEGSKGGVIILVRNDIQAVEFTKDTNENAEINGIRIAFKNRELLVYNFYCPANKQLSLDSIDIPDAGCLILGDFNSHSQSWGYDDMYHRGEEVEDWQIDQNLQLLNDPEDQDTFYSRRWRTSTPDLGFATDDIAKCTTRCVQDQLAGSDHRPIMLTVNLNMKRSLTYIPPRWNYKKVNWSKFASRSDILTTRININTRQIDKATKPSQRQSSQQHMNAFHVGLEETTSPTGPKNCRPCMRKSQKQETKWKKSQVLTTTYVSRPKLPDSEEKATRQ
ncbi:hypothetical protein ElyMa_001220600 [Elysia marginata]|uniref:Endonuclease/exonuclease/phosphatase domain-containing protein n=1 Tax=Elysia marginata TaxID=1093978 RepID=A0AAV4I7F2_9GAST|nr:hypothetical protein ElyMa_001220600 [Elysia marginata]